MSYNESLAIRREIGDKRGIGTTLINLGLPKSSGRTTTGRSNSTGNRFRFKWTSATLQVKGSARTTSRRFS